MHTLVDICVSTGKAIYRVGWVLLTAPNAVNKELHLNVDVYSGVKEVFAEFIRSENVVVYKVLLGVSDRKDGRSSVKRRYIPEHDPGRIASGRGRGL